MRRSIVPWAPFRRLKLPRIRSPVSFSSYQICYTSSRRPWIQAGGAGEAKSTKPTSVRSQLAPEARQKVARGKRGARRPWITSPNTTRPERAREASPNISLVVFNRTEFQHLKIFLLKCLAPMVLFLIKDVILHMLDLGMTDRDTQIAGLPLKLILCALSRARFGVGRDPGAARQALAPG